MIFNTIILTVFPGIMIYAAIMDMFTMTIPNRISLVLVAVFVLMVPFTGLGLADIAMHLVAGLVMLAITFGMFSAGWIGGGDAKFFAATALWIGFNEALFMYSMTAAILGGLLTFFMLMINKFPVPPFLVKQKWFMRLHGLKDGVPYGITLAIAGVMIFPDTVWMKVMNV